MLAAKKTSVVSVKGFGVNLVGVMVLAFAFGTLWTIVSNTVYGGSMVLLYVIAVIKLSDMGGFAFGTAFGRHKMCPSVSPNKSWEGLCGSIIASVVMSWIFVKFVGVPNNFPLWKTVTVGVVGAVVGTAGDLTESAFKRWVGVKDSGTFMPAGLGGLLDMFDSLLFAPWLTWLLVRGW